MTLTKTILNRYIEQYGSSILTNPKHEVWLQTGVSPEWQSDSHLMSEIHNEPENHPKYIQIHEMAQETLPLVGVDKLSVLKISETYQLVPLPLSHGQNQQMVNECLTHEHEALNLLTFQTQLNHAAPCNAPEYRDSQEASCRAILESSPSLMHSTNFRKSVGADSVSECDARMVSWCAKSPNILIMRQTCRIAFGLVALEIAVGSLSRKISGGNGTKY